MWNLKAYKERRDQKQFNSGYSIKNFSFFFTIKITISTRKLWKTTKGQGGVRNYDIVVQISCLEVLLVSRVNQATQSLFSTEFSY